MSLNVRGTGGGRTWGRTSVRSNLGGPFGPGGAGWRAGWRAQRAATGQPRTLCGVTGHKSSGCSPCLHPLLDRRSLSHSQGAMLNSRH